MPTRSRAFAVALMLCFVGGFFAFVAVSKANAAPADCTQSWARVMYTYDDPSSAPAGVDYNGVSDADVTSGSQAGQPGCESFQSPLSVRLSTMRDTHVTTTVQFVYGPLDTTPDRCSGVVEQPADSNGVTVPVVLDPSINTDGTVSMSGSITVDSAFLSDPLADHLGSPVAFPASLWCDDQQVSQTSFLVTAYGEPSDTSVSLARTTSKTASRSGSAVHGRLVSRKHPVADQRVVIQRHTASGWHRLVKIRTDHFGRYSLTLHDTHALRARYAATLRYWGSVSKAR